jgi:hypothetical protein
MTSPVGPMAMSPKFPTVETSCSAPQAPNVSAPVTLRPRALIPPESSRHVTHTEFSPATTVGWSRLPAAPVSTGPRLVKFAPRSEVTNSSIVRGLRWR